MATVWTLNSYIDKIASELQEKVKDFRLIQYEEMKQDQIDLLFHQMKRTKFDSVHYEHQWGPHNFKENLIVSG